MTQDEFKTGVLADGTRLMQPDHTPVWRFDLGSTVWPGLFKYIEESTEAGTIVAKIMENEGRDAYFDGTDLRARLVEELGDQLAAIAFVQVANQLDADAISARCDAKYDQYWKWHLETLKARGGPLPEPEPKPEPETYTAEWLRAEVMKNGWRTLSGGRGYWSFDDDMKTVWWMSEEPPVLLGYDDLAKHFAELPDDEARVWVWSGALT